MNLHYWENELKLSYFIIENLFKLVDKNSHLAFLLFNCLKYYQPSIPKTSYECILYIQVYLLSVQNTIHPIIIKCYIPSLIGKITHKYYYEYHKKTIEDHLTTIKNVKEFLHCILFTDSSFSKDMNINNIIWSISGIEEFFSFKGTYDSRPLLHTSFSVKNI
jgi:hypothetical protein